MLFASQRVITLYIIISKKIVVSRSVAFLWCCLLKHAVVLHLFTVYEIILDLSEISLTPKKVGIAIGALGVAALAGYAIYKLAGSRDPPRDRPDVPERVEQMRRIRMRAPMPSRAPPTVDRLLHSEARTR